MAHNDYVRPDGQWPFEFVLTPGDLRRFDVAQFQALDGDAGGTWVPLTPITIGGSSIVLTGGVSLGHTISGGVLTLSGGRVYLGASIYPSFPAVSRTIGWLIQARAFAQQSIAGTRFATKYTIGGVNAFAVPVPPRQLHNGATIASANVTFQIGQFHAVTPGVLPQAQLIRNDWLPWNPIQWSGLTPFAAGAIVQPTTAYANFPFAYVATGAGGTSAAGEPNWNTAAGINLTVVDGSVTWVATGYASNAAAWQSGRAYIVGSAITPTVKNGLVYVATSVSGTHTSGGTEPVWPLAIGATVTDNPGGNLIVWTCVGTPRAATWTPTTTYLVGAIVSASPDNGMYYKASVGGASGSGPPAWGTVVGGTTPDGAGALVWTCLGSNPIGAGAINTATAGAFPATSAVYFNAGATQTMSVPCHGATKIDTVDYSYAYLLFDEGGIGAFEPANVPPWSSGVTYVLANTVPGPFVEPNPANGYYYACIVGGTSGTPPPTWPTVIGSNVIEVHGSGGSGGTGPTWQCWGLSGQSLNLFMVVSFAFTSIVDMRPE